MKLLGVACMLMFVAISPALGAEVGVVPVLSPNDPDSAQLVMEPKKWDGREITFTGEAITEALERGDMAWVHINDDAYYLRNVEEGAELGGYNSGQAVWMPRELAEKITYFGDYTNEGDVVSATGVFNAACGQHGGDMDIHATALEIREIGHRVHEPVKLEKAAVALVLALLSVVLWVATRRVEHKELGGGFIGR